MCFPIFAYCAHGDLGGFLLRKSEYASRNAAECDASDTVFRSESQTALITAFQQPLMDSIQRSVNDGADGMQRPPQARDH